MRQRSIGVSIGIAGILFLLSATAHAQAGAAPAPRPEPAKGSSAGEGAPRPAAAAAATAAPAPPSGQVARYVVPYYTSQNLLPGARSVTMVDVYNQSSISCEVGLQFQFAFGTTNVCSISLSIPPKQSRLFCSRPVNDPMFPCTVSCPGTGLTFNTGHAFVSSTADPNSDCARIAIHAQLAFTRDAADDQIEATTQLSVVEINYGNNGD